MSTQRSDFEPPRRAPSTHDAVAVPGAIQAADLPGLLERVRKRLLDLSASNRLLSFRHTAASSVRVVDEVPAVVFERVKTGQPMRFAPLRGAAELLRDEADEGGSYMTSTRRGDRNRAEIAERLGIATSFDLPLERSGDDDRHTDEEIQTLLLPQDLEKILRSIHQKARTSIQETGANVLHLVFGFVEWADQPIEDPNTVTRFAPLVLVPVAIERKDVDRATSTFLYEVRATGEHWDTNVTLQEKCSTDLGHRLPGIEEDEDLHAYFARIESWLTEHTRGWRLRRQVTLGMASFGKILMWRDLDPANWPAGTSLLDQPLLREILGVSEPPEGGDSHVLGDHAIDELPPNEVPPTILDADSSQHSVLVDAARGKSLVVQGPPGTGKSQTIANLIAGQIRMGKRVLFVAEKKAALDVVLRRLDQTGMGPFCLALHSHTSHRKNFLEGLEQRLALRAHPDAPPPRAAALREERERARAALNDHARRMHEPLPRLGMSPFEVLWRARRLLDELPEVLRDAISRAEIRGAHEMDPVRIREGRREAEAFGACAGDVLAAAPSFAQHPWAGVTHPGLDQASIDALLDHARSWHAALAATLESLGALEAIVRTPLGQTSRDLHGLATRVSGLVPPSRSGARLLLGPLHASRRQQQVAVALRALAAARAAWAGVEGSWSERPPDPPTLERHLHAAKEAAALVGSASDLASVRRGAAALAALRDHLAAAREGLAHAAPLLGASPLGTVEAADAIVSVVRDARELSPVAFALRSDALAGALQTIEQLERGAAKLRAARDELRGMLDPALRPPLAELRGHVAALANAPRFLPALFSSRYRAAIRAHRTASGRREKRTAIEAELRRLLQHEDDVARFSRDPGLRYLGSRASGIDSPFADAAAAARWMVTAATRLAPLGESGAPVLAAVRSAPPEVWRAATAACDRHLGADVPSLVEHLRSAGDLITARLPELGGQDLAVSHRHVATLHALVEAALAAAADAGLAEGKTLPELEAIAEQVMAARRADAMARPAIDELAAFGLDAASDDHRADMNEAVSFLAALDLAALPGSLAAGLSSDQAAQRLEQVRGALATILERAGLAERGAVAFAAAARIDPVLWQSAGGPDAIPLRLAAARLQAALAASPALYAWARFQAARAGMERLGAADVRDLVESGQLGGAQAPAAFEAAVYTSAARSVLRADGNLDRFTGNVHEQVRQRFLELDEQSLKLTAGILRSELARSTPVRGVRTGPVRDLTEEGLIQQQAGLQRPSVPIRDLFRRAARAIVKLKPCFMMSPQAISQYLPRDLSFDLVVMDEASQIKPEDALGAIARGKQLIVVGDPRQLGPTSFFDRQLDDGDEDEEEGVATPLGGPTVFERSESILNAAALRFPMRMLKWHYRSRHPRLIAFSNEHFYRSELVVFPTPSLAAGQQGLLFHPVAGCYSGQKNEKEAQAVVAALREHAAQRPGQSALVATMNFNQAELIDALLQKAEKEDPQLAEYRKAHADGLEPLEVKNLENVQGDERDCILVSMTYGPDEAGRFVRRFGPVNNQGGERRLNVLFTRAKERLEVFCSFDARMISIGEQTPPGVRVLHDYLRYAQDGTWAAGVLTDREPDSDFEIAVARALRGAGFDVHPQVGVASYRLDLAVVHPRRPGEYVLGIECDGATYHSARSARDRDRLRQRALEKYGWRIHRIWSTDWFRDPAGQMARVVSEIHRLAGAA